MKMNLQTPFDHVERFAKTIKDNPSLWSTQEGQTWLHLSLRHLRRTTVLELKVLRRGESSNLVLLNDPPTSRSALPYWSRPMIPYFSARVKLELFWLQRKEGVFESTRQFYFWLSRLLQTEAIIREVMEKDFADLKGILRMACQALAERKAPSLDFTIKALPNPFSPLGEGKWPVPLVRSLRLLHPRERISSHSLVEVIRKALEESYRRQMEHLWKDFRKSMDTTLHYLEVLHAYRMGDTTAKGLEEVYLQRSAKLIDRFSQEMLGQINSAQESSLAYLTIVFATLNHLKTSSWLRVKRQFAFQELKKIAHQVGEKRGRLHEATARGEAWYHQLINEKLKPAMGISAKVKIQARHSFIDQRWTQVPHVPQPLAEVILDQENPSLLVIPPQISAIMNSLQEYYQQHQTGHFLFQTDHLAGSFGMLGYLLTLHFPGRKYRIYRPEFTKPIQRVPDFEEPILFLANFERMVLIDEDHLSMAMDLVEQAMILPKLVVISMNHLTAEYLRAAIPSFSRFLFEINLHKYEFVYFKGIIEKRMVISGFQFSFQDEALFWSRLYELSSGIPGVGLRILLRCVNRIDGDKIMLSCDLPQPRDYFHGLALKELIILRKIYMHPYLEIEAINPADVQKTRLAVANLCSMGLLISRGHRYALRPEFCGCLRDYLMQTNLA